MDPKQAEAALTIETLKETIRTLEESKLNLVVTIKELKDKLAQQKDDQADIYYFLNKKCDESFEIIATLEEQLLNEQADREISEKLYESKIEELRVSSSGNEAKLQTRVTDLENRLEMLNHFAESKDETERVMKDLMVRLEEEREQFRVNADTMENRFLLEREKLRKSYDIKYESLKKEIEASIDGKLSKKTQKTQIMNVIMKKELDTQSRHAERLLEINEQLVDKEKQLSRDLDLAHGLQHETLLKLHHLTSKLRGAEETLREKDAEVARLQAQFSQETEAKRKHIAQLSTRAKVATEQLQKSFAETDELWQFLKSCYKRYSTQAASNEDTTDLQGMDPHEALLIRLLKELALKYPDFLAKYVKVGLDIQQRSKAGIYSWDKEKGGQRTETLMNHKSVQTDEPQAPPQSVWLHTSPAALEAAEASLSLSASSSYPHPSRQYRLSDMHTASELQENSSLSAYSVPSLIGKVRSPLLSLPASSISDGLDAKSLASMQSAPPLHKKTPYVVKKTPFTSVQELGKALEKKHADAKRLPSDWSNGLLHDLDKGLRADGSSLDGMQVAGRKFVAPVLLPKIK